MAKTTKEQEKTLEKNMEYIGLNLNKIPSFLKQNDSLNFRPSKSYDDTVYKVYKYVNINLTTKFCLCMHRGVELAQDLFLGTKFVLARISVPGLQR